MHVSALVCLLAAVSSAFSEPVVTPKHQQVQYPGTAVVRCKFSQPLLNCRVRLTELSPSKDFDKVIDLGSGPRSARVPLSRSDGRLAATASYEGDGLSAGHCGVSLAVEWPLLLLVECLGQTKNHGWSRGIGLVTAHGLPVLAVTSGTPSLMVVKSGNNGAVLLKAEGALNRCDIRTSSEGSLSLRQGESPPSDRRYRLHGAGLEQGECGYRLFNATQRDSGVWRHSGSQNGTIAVRGTVVLVAAVPEGEPVLTVQESASLRVGSTLTATCRAPPGAPPAKLTWLLDGQVVRQDDGNDVMPALHIWQPTEAVQTLKRRLTEADVGKRLECRADHLSGSWSGSDSWLIAASISAPPRVAAPGAGCPTLATHSVLASCSLSNAAVNCSSAPVPRGTTAHLKCREGFTKRANHPGTLTTTCTARGRWRPQPFSCDLDCGVRRSDSRQLSVGGKLATKSEFPWHVAIFQMDRESFKYICGGSLVTENFFITAAHCLYRPATRKAENETLYRAAFGKHSLSWETIDEHEQRRTLKTIHLHERYEGSAKRYESDIAIVQLSTPVDVTLAVNVVCVDWKTEFEYQQLITDNLGTVPGWGVTEDNTLSTTLRYVDLPYVSFPACRASVPWDFRNHLVLGKFCGGYSNSSTSVCQGDSGGGFVFHTQKLIGTRYYLRGVVSNSPMRSADSSKICEAEHRTVFTQVSFYAPWLEGIVFGASDYDDDY